MSSTEYIKSSRYENLICIAFNCSPGSRHGSRMAYMQNVMRMERGVKITGIGSLQKQFEKLKSYIAKALVKYSKSYPYKKEADFFLHLHQELDLCHNSEELMRIVDLALEKVVSLKNKKLYDV